eukprot:3298127-Pyramimonas_sp.AAC.1
MQEQQRAEGEEGGGGSARRIETKRRRRGRENTRTLTPRPERRPREGRAMGQWSSSQTRASGSWAGQRLGEKSHNPLRCPIELLGFLIFSFLRPIDT